MNRYTSGFRLKSSVILMACANISSIFVNDLPSYGLIGLISLGLVLYFAYLIAFIRNQSSASVYISFSQLSLFFVLISPMIFLIQPGFSQNLICSSQTLAIQILPFCFLLGYNIHFISQWLVKLTKSPRRSPVISISSFLIFFLMILIQTAILLIWFYHNHSSEEEQCTDQCHRSYFLCSLIFHFILLFLYALQSSIKYHYHGQKKHCICLFTSLLALGVDIIWMGFYLFRPSTVQIEQNYILAYGLIFFAYSFLGPFLYEQMFYRREGSMEMNNVRVRRSSQGKIKALFFCFDRLIEQHSNVCPWPRNNNGHLWLRMSKEISQHPVRILQQKRIFPYRIKPIPHDIQH